MSSGGGGSGAQAASAFGAFAGAVGALSQGIAANRQAKYNAAIVRQNAAIEKDALDNLATQERINADLATQDATLAREGAAFREQQIRLQGGRLQGRARAVIGASGVTFEGSPIEVLVDNATQLETEALLTRYVGEIQARAHTIEAQRATYRGTLRRYEGRRTLLVAEQEARMLKMMGKQALINSYIQAAQYAAQAAGSSAQIIANDQARTASQPRGTATPTYSTTPQYMGYANVNPYQTSTYNPY